jgi:uncharacterized protein (TIGR02246 family)
MNSDESEISNLISTWMAATKAGDIETVLGLMTEDVVFLQPGQRSMIGRAAFAEAAKAMAGKGLQFDGRSEIQEIKVVGDWAFTWTKLTVISTPAGGQSTTRAGFTLSVLKKENGKWVLARDANMLSPATPDN